MEKELKTSRRVRYEKSSRTNSGFRHGLRRRFFHLKKSFSGAVCSGVLGTFVEWWTVNRRVLSLLFLAAFPGVCLVAVGLCVINAPELVAYAVASVLVALGVVLVIVGLKLVQMTLSFSTTLNSLKDKVAFHSVQIKAPRINESGQVLTAEEIKKIIIH